MSSGVCSNQEGICCVNVDFSLLCMWRLDTFPKSKCVQQNTIDGEGSASVTEEALNHTLYIL